MKDFTSNVETSGSVNVGGGDNSVGKAEVTANADTVDGMVSPVSMMIKKVNIRTVRSRFSGRYGSLFVLEKYCLFKSFGALFPSYWCLLSPGKSKRT